MTNTNNPTPLPELEPATGEAWPAPALKTTRAVQLHADGYERLAEVLSMAFAQASEGKGKERHANALPFHEQPMQQIAHRRGIGFLLGQADKKTEEAQGMYRRCQSEAAIRELLGAINYLAGAVIFIQGRTHE